MIRKVLVNTLVKQFYQSNAGFFLVTLGLFFGFLKVPQHMDIAGVLATNPIYYLVPLVLWSLYAVKTLNFVISLKRSKAHLFVTDLVLLEAMKRKPLIIYIQTLLLAPALVYSLLLLFMAVKLNEIQSALFVVAGNLIILLISAHILHHWLVRPLDSGTTRKRQFWTSWLPKNFSTLFLHHLFNKQPIGLLSTKVFSIAVVIGASTIFQSSEGDLRILTLGMLMTSAINSPLTFRQTEFEFKSQCIFANLPIARWKKAFWTFMGFWFLILPEMVVLIGNNLGLVEPIHFFELTFMLVSLLLFYYTISVTRRMVMDQFVKYPFFLTAMLFFVILGYVNSLLISTAMMILSLGIYFSNRFTPDLIETN